jgi:hypothetical protein
MKFSVNRSNHNTGLGISGIIGSVFLVLSLFGCPSPNNSPGSPPTPPAVSSVTVAPKTVDIWKGRIQDFTAIVEGKNNPDQGVTWSVSGNSSADTKFDDNILYVAVDETSEHFTVTATSTLDSRKSGASTVNLVRPIVTGVTILQQDAAIHRGGTMEFNATVEGPRGPDQDVQWSVEGNSSKDTKFEGNKLTIAADENNTSWTVKATSYYDGENSGTTTVKLAYKINSPHNQKGKVLATYQGLMSEFAPAGREITLVVEPEPRFKLLKLNYAYGSKSSNSIDISAKTFTMPESDITVSADFGDFSAGDRGPGGGWVFYVESDENKIAKQGWKYLECAPTDANNNRAAPWGPLSEVGVAAPNDYGQGKGNTAKITAKGTSWPAAANASAYAFNGISGWYLPCQKEMEEIKKTLSAVAEFSQSLKGQYYWTSSEENALSGKGKRALAVPFKPGSGSFLAVTKSTSLNVRPVRQF